MAEGERFTAAAMLVLAISGLAMVYLVIRNRVTAVGYGCAYADGESLPRPPSV